MKLITKNLTFTLNDNAVDPRYFILGEDVTAEGADFWRLILDDGMKTEIPVFSHAQSGFIEKTEGGYAAVYEGIVSDYGDRYDITFRLEMEARGELIRFTPVITNNHEGVRVNECFCPMTDVVKVAGEKKSDVLYMPVGLGERAVNPWAKMQSLNASFYNHNEFETVWHQHYPQGSMSWCGVESNGKFLYTAQYDGKIRCCFISARQKIKSNPYDLMLCLDRFPMARYGETVTLASGVVGVLDGDWRSGAKEYRAYADREFYKIPEKAEWVKNMTGWQRIIMRSQYGEDYFKPEDLPFLYKTGMKYGINTLFLFAWWKAGMDRNYPHYEEPYEGAWAALKENIDEIRKLGGRVILECNCHFLDPTGEFYKQFGEEVKIVDINGNEVRPSFAYPGYGEFRVKYGNKQFPVACSCTERWRNQVLSQIALMDELGADCLFADCYGAAPTQPCFNDKHEHGARVDEDWVGKRKFFAAAEKYAYEHGKVLATEITTDIASSYNQFVHGWFNQDFNHKSDYFPAMFRYTFPEVITTNRGVRCAEGEFDMQLKFALIMGVRYDAELFVCRTHLDSCPEYAEVIKFCTDFMQEHREFVMDGTFTMTDVSPLPACVKHSEFISASGDKLMKIWLNTADHEVSVNGKGLKSGEIYYEITDYIE